LVFKLVFDKSDIIQGLLQLGENFGLPITTNKNQYVYEMIKHMEKNIFNEKYFVDPVVANDIRNHSLPILKNYYFLLLPLCTLNL